MWLLLIVVYVAPPDAVNWKGNWQLGPALVRDERFANEASCLNAGSQIKTKLKEGMLAPVRYHCIKVDAGLPPDVERWLVNNLNAQIQMQEHLEDIKNSWDRAWPPWEIGMSDPCLPLVLYQWPEGIEQILISTLDQWAISIQGKIQIPLLGIPPDLSADGLPPGLGDWIVKTTKAIDEMVPPVEPQPDL